ncbi:MAG: UbiX family flavin prenyltransferase [Staphylothermus sp.]|nr:UbiX family flavin prenyltransferase [Staphylothermus sp.]
MTKIIIGISGASGIVYSLKLIDQCELLRSRYKEIYVIYTRSSELIARYELGITDLRRYLETNKCISKVFSEEDIDSFLASSSNLYDADMVIIPSSMNTVAKLAHGIQDNLLLRVASSLLRIKRKLIIVFRETPISRIDLENLSILAKEGAIIFPASPAFYIKPKTVDDLVFFIIGKILDLLGIENELYSRWGTS